MQVLTESGRARHTGTGKEGFTSSAARCLLPPCHAGLMSIDKLDIEVIKRSGSDHERWLVEKIQPVSSFLAWPAS